MSITRIKLNKFYIMCPVALFCCILWGSAFPIIKVGYQTIGIDNDDTSSIILFAGLRFMIAGLLTIIIFSFIEKQFLLPKKRSLKNITILSVFQTIIQYLFFYLGLAHTTGTRASIIDGLNVFFVLFISAFLFKQEKFNITKTVGCLCGFVGVAVAGGLFSGSLGSQIKIGDFYIVLSALGYSFSSVIMKEFSKRDNPALLSGYQFVLGGTVLALTGYAMGGRITINLKGFAILIYLALVSAVAYSLWSLLLKYNDVSKITVFSSFTPIFGFVLSYVILGEDNGSLIFNIIGLVLVVAGMLVINSNSKKINIWTS